MSAARAALTRRWAALRDLLAAPSRYIDARMQRWILRRLPHEPAGAEVSRRRLYIVPTRFGYGFAVLGLLMLLAAMNYSNSMAYALCFLLAGLGLVSMHFTHANLLRLRLRPGRAEPVFAGESACFHLMLENASPEPRHAIGLAAHRGTVQESVDVEAHGSARLSLRVPTQKRGWLRVRCFEVVTEFPLGLFHAWTLMDVDLHCLVYPQPAASGIPLRSLGGGSGDSAGHGSGQDEFAGLRSYQPGDPLRSIHWKSYPKTGTLMVKQFADTVERELWLDWHALPGLEIEARIAQLARWVIEAETSGRPYGLRLPGERLEPGHGEAHRHRCLQLLALFDGAAA